MSFSSSKIIAISVGVGVLSATSLLLFFLLRKNEEEDCLLEVQKEAAIISHSNKRVAVPKEAVGRIIGRNGENIKNVQERTKTVVKFVDEAPDDDTRILNIQGFVDNVWKAEQLIIKLINEKPSIETDEILVHHKFCGKVIGVEGENIRRIGKVSGAKVIVQRSNEKDNEGMRKIVVRGLPNQIKKAKTLIEEQVENWQKTSNQTPSPSATQNTTPLKNISYYNDELAQYNQNMYTREKLSTSCSDGFLEVFVSAVNTLDQFWVQLVTGKSIELDRLVEEMTDYYSQPENKSIHKIEELSVGDVVAAPFPYDNSWYRVEISTIEEDSYSDEDCKVTVHYVDFGESETLTKKDILLLKRNFLRIPFQAIECCLANIQPKDSVWSNEANTIFEKLTYTAEWKAIRLKVVGQKKRENETDSIYSVEMVDTNGPHDVKIAEEMVKQGFAVWSKEE